MYDAGFARTDDIDKLAGMREGPGFRGLHDLNHPNWLERIIRIPPANANDVVFHD